MAVMFMLKNNGEKKVLFCFWGAFIKREFSIIWKNTFQKGFPGPIKIGLFEVLVGGNFNVREVG